MYREEWLHRAAIIADEHLFKQHNYKVPRVRYGVAPLNESKRGAKHTTLGVCYNAKLSDDHTYEVWIDASVDDARTAFATMVHEIVHAVDELKNGHRAPFKKIAERVGLTGNMTATTMTDETWRDIKPLVDRLGPYPHAALNTRKPAKKQSTRQKKFYCPVTQYKVYMSRGQYHEYGSPICPCCRNDMTTDSEM